MAQLLLSTALVTAFILWFSPEARAAVWLRFPRLLDYAGASLLILLVATGRLHWLLGLILGAVLLGRRLPAKLSELAGYRRNNHRANDCSHVQANSLALTIDLRSGVIDGTIRGGRLQGCQLSQLALAELLELRNGWRIFDSEAAALLTAYLDQAHAGWRAHSTDQNDGNTSRGNDGVLSQAQAYAMLGLANGASREQIIAAHRRLMQRLHPDRGGSGYLAARINEAKAQLLRGHR